MGKQDVITLCLELILTDKGTQMRAALNDSVVADYRDQWKAGTKFDPVDVFFDGKHYYLADGFHRYFGAKHAERTSIPCYVRQGTLRDAILFAVGANQQHGLRRTNEDKRSAVQRLLNDEEWVAWSDHKIAEHAGVSQQFVSATRKELTTVVNSPAAAQADKPRTGKDGKTYKAKSKPGKVRSQSDEPSNGRPDAPPAPVATVNEDSEPDEPDTGKVATQRSKTVKTVEALMRAFDDLNGMVPKQYHKATIESCKRLLQTARDWK